jgi:hypothetical protein
MNRERPWRVPNVIGSETNVDPLSVAKPKGGHK